MDNTQNCDSYISVYFSTLRNSRNYYENILILKILHN
jgi:hypothetical protein